MVIIGSGVVYIDVLFASLGDIFDINSHMNDKRSKLLLLFSKIVSRYRVQYILVFSKYVWCSVSMFGVSSQHGSEGRVNIRYKYFK